MRKWQNGDRLRHRKTHELATVTEFWPNQCFASGYFVRLHYDPPLKYSQVNGDWQTVRADWVVVNIPAAAGPTVADP